jgi:1-acyl-sn-glycerol-3-phosphate acyltransferase
LIAHHGLTGLDMMLLRAKLLIHRNTKVVPVADKFFWQVPGLRSFAEILDCTTGTVEQLVQLLKDDKIVVIYPGGAREALYSSNYQLLWNSRKGFARVAIQAKAVKLNKTLFKQKIVLFICCYFKSQSFHL